MDSSEEVRTASNVPKLEQTVSARIMESFKSVIQHTQSMGKVSLKMYSERLALCQACPELANRLTGRYCKLCGCFVKAKAMREGDSCPIGKW